MVLLYCGGAAEFVVFIRKLLENVQTQIQFFIAIENLSIQILGY